MTLVKQRGGSDCGVATAAMLAGVSYETALAAVPNPKSRYLTVGRFVATMKGLGREVAISRRHYGRPLASMPNPDGALIIRKPTDRVGHFVAADAGVILDPQIGRHPMNTYPRRDWRVIREAK